MNNAFLTQYLDALRAKGFNDHESITYLILGYMRHMGKSGIGAVVQDAVDYKLALWAEYGVTEADYGDDGLKAVRA